MRTRPWKKSTIPLRKIYPSIDALVDESREMFEERGWWSEIFAEVKRYGAVQLEDGKYTDSWGKIAGEYMKHYLFYQFTDYYKKVKCPLLMMPDVYPGQDEREKEIMAGLFKLAAHGKIVSVPEWVHPFGWMLTPEAGSRAVLNFLGEVSDKKSSYPAN